MGGKISGLPRAGASPLWCTTDRSTDASRGIEGRCCTMYGSSTGYQPRETSFTAELILVRARVKSHHGPSGCRL